MNWTAIILIIVVCQLVPGISTVPVEPRWNLRQETIQRGMSKLKSIHNSCSPFIFRRSYRSCSQLSEKSCSKSTGTVPLQSNNTLANYIFYQILRFYGCWMNQMCMRPIQILLIRRKCRFIQRKCRFMQRKCQILMLSNPMAVSQAFKNLVLLLFRLSPWLGLAHTMPVGDRPVGVGKSRIVFRESCLLARANSHSMFKAPASWCGNCQGIEAQI